jgi:acetate kinase
MNNLINKRSGVAGVSGISSDMRDIKEAFYSGNLRAIDTLKRYAYRVKKYIGAYTAAMNGVDLILFTGGIGENDVHLRELICESISFFGVDFDKTKNDGLRGKDAVITKEGSKTTVMVVTTDEELVIANDTFNLVKK